MNVVCFGQQNWDVCWTGKQQWASRLAARGHRVLYVDPDHAAAPSGAGLRHVGPGALHVYTRPPVGRLGWRQHGVRQRRRIAALARRLLPGPRLAVALRPDVGAALDALAPDALVYYAVDEWTAFGDQDDATRAALRAAEDAMLQRCDLALAVSPTLLERFRTLQPASRLAPNGADVEHFGAASLARAPSHPGLADLEGPCIGFVGQIDDRFDVALIAAVAERRPAWTFALAGRTLERAGVGPLDALPNVRRLGYVAYDDLPSVLRCFDVCTVPYRLSPLTRACHPLKVLEYLATGRPVVATPLDGLGSAAAVVRIAAGVDAFEGELAAALADPAAGRDVRLALAAASSWDARVDDLEREFAALLAARRGRGLRGSRFAALAEPAERSHEYGTAAPSEAPSWRERAAIASARIRWPRRGLRRILVARQGQLGDLCVLVPAVRELRRRLPDAHIVLGGDDTPVARRLFAGLVDAIRPLRFSTDGGVGERLRWIGARFDAVLTGPGYLTPREAFQVGAPRRVGIYDGHPLQRGLTDTEPLDRRRHEVATNLRSVERLVGGLVDGPVDGPVDIDQPFRIDLPRGDAAALRARLGIAPAAEIVVVHPGAAKPSRRWPAERFAAVVERLLAASPQRCAVLTGVARERGLADTVRGAVDADARDRVVDATAATSFEELVTLLGDARLLVANDTGVMHLARGLGVPVCAVLGPDEPRRWGPAPDGIAPAVAVRAAVPCAPCARVACAEQYCLRSTSVEAVVAAALELLEGEPRGTRLDLRERRVDFVGLAAAGFRLPTLAAVALPGPVDRRALTLADLGRQTWPGGDLVLDPVPGGDVAVEPRWRLRRADTARPGAVLAATDAELLLLVPAGARLAPEAVAAHVAGLVRRPDADRCADLGRGRGAPLLVRRGFLDGAAFDWKHAFAETRRGATAIAHVDTAEARG